MGIFYLVFATIVSFLVLKIQTEKKLHKQNSDSVETSNNNNTKSHNKDLVTTFISVGIFILATIAGLGGVLNSLLLLERYQIIWFLSQDLAHPALILLFVPVLLFNHNQDLVKFVQSIKPASRT